MSSVPQVNFVSHTAKCATVVQFVDFGRSEEEELRDPKLLLHKKRQLVSKIREYRVSATVPSSLFASIPFESYSVPTRMTKGS